MYDTWKTPMYALAVAARSCSTTVEEGAKVTNNQTQQFSCFLHSYCVSCPLG